MRSMKVIHRSVLCAAGAAFALLTAAAAATPALAADATPGSDWKFQTTLYVWATSLTGDVGVRNLPTASVDVPFSDVLRNTDGALMGAFVARNGKWLLLADLVYAKLSDTQSVGTFGGSRLDATITQTIASGAVGYLLPTGLPNLDLALTAGARYTNIKSSMTFDPNGPLKSVSGDQRKTWIDPTVGFAGHFTINEKWFADAVADIGGFDVGSKISSSGYAGIGYNWTPSLSTSLGYRYLYENYEDSGNATGTFRYKTTMHGPTVALSWKF